MKNVSVFLLLLLFSLVGCRKAAKGSSWGAPDYRLPMEAATTADEWLERFDKDRQSNAEAMQYHYAELPPVEEWEKVLAGLEERLKLPDDELLPDSYRSYGRGSVKSYRLGYRLFASLLREDHATSEKLFRELVKDSSGGYWSDRDLVDQILSLSRDAEEGLRWIKAEKPDLLTRKEPNYSSSSEEAEPWRKKLAEGNVDEGIELLWEQSGDDGSDGIEALERLVKLGDLLGDKDLRDRALENLGKRLSKKGTRFHEKRDWIKAMAQDGRWKELKELAENEPEDEFNDDDAPSRLAMIATYHLDGGAKFIAELEGFLSGKAMTRIEYLEFLNQAYDVPESLGIVYLAALSEVGRKEEASSLAHHLVAMNRGLDNYYELARKHDPDGFPALLDQLHAFDPFEERPLIWKAELALAEGNVDEARKHIDAAIALDPSDGDQGKDSRMKAYEVLSRILSAQGDEEKSAFFKEVVESIRDGEVADDYLYAGLIKEATERYQKALGKFGDAYCLQSRLALTLARNGRFAEAVPHFEKAFELMPVSFGPRESHCFGCEGLFSDERVRPIAEKVLKSFLEAHPENPRAPYLLGLVFESMGRGDEAVTLFRKALELDPQYFNAAKQLDDALAISPTSFQERKALLPKLLKIAPYPEIGRYFARRTDLRQAWIDAGSVRPSPLKLPSLPGAPTGKEEQFTSEWQSSYLRGDLQSMDGWSREELCGANELMDQVGSN